ncbi:hypothetical protein H6S82_02775 [Planktothrix sp. FACHB-1355]|uniref:FHA domain containing protein n=1 Tax=Aerosakkonema funiforme FACHB-1375 TaxID=2949571 RepID=A0A926VAU6_9CYAN|nr:hypothetical protein [Aerosakkonema funiforme]MBD2180135.1 hypothetical protein [Aerosakkonema funiforme FACHB-1375]MBD3557779.1 hypothetical protein [Planktothrix sp. FACHB-1355]
MLDTNWQQRAGKALVTSFLIAGILVLSLTGCGGRTSTSGTPGNLNTAPNQNAPKIAEVSPPQVIQELRQALETYQPQVSIVSPQPNEVLNDNTVTVRFQVQDLPIFKNPELGLGPHLQVFLDNQPYQGIYDPNEPLIYKDLAPGTHTLRVFASRPWHESFKNEGAYAQTTFHIFTKTDDNNPDPAEPLLTYSRPQASYGAEPIMLDFYLTNAPLHLVAQEDPQDNISDWRIRCTINGESFIIDRWQPIYLTGFQPGKNWVQLELLDEQGNPVKNAFNNTVRLITYEPNGNDTLSRLVRGQLSAADARGIVDRNYIAKQPEPEPTPEPAVEATPTPDSAVEATPTLEPTPESVPLVTPAPEVIPPSEPSQEEPTKAETDREASKSAETQLTEPKPIQTPQPSEYLNRFQRPDTITEPTQPKAVEKPGFGGFFNRFRRPQIIKPSPTPPEAIETPTPPLIPTPPTPSPETVSAPQTEVAPTPSPETVPVPQTEVVPTPSGETVPAPQTEIAPTPTAETLPPPLPETSETLEQDLAKSEKGESKDSENADRIETNSATEASPSADLPPTLPEIIETPTPQPITPELQPSQLETSSPPQIEASETNGLETTPVPQAEATDTTNGNSGTSDLEAKSSGLPASEASPTILEVKSSPNLPPTLPEIIETSTPELKTPHPSTSGSETLAESKADEIKIPEAKSNQPNRTAQEAPNEEKINQFLRFFQPFRRSPSSLSTPATVTQPIISAPRPTVPITQATQQPEVPTSEIEKSETSQPTSEVPSVTERSETPADGRAADVVTET